uniref:ATP-grasp fold amidoligase family protein n=1 Tax=Flavobacterium sp. TaxID=239 RepID=UPI00404AAD92
MQVDIHIIKTLGVWDNADHINYDLLPKSFIIKTNHASGQNIIIKNKYDFDKKNVNITLNKWLKLNYSAFGREYQYEKIRPLILVEPLINDQDDAPLNDYKFYCFNGNPMYVQVDFDRFTKHTRNFYDMNWNLQDFSILYPNNKKLIEKPINFDKMIEIAQKLSLGFPFIRVDLYSYGNKVYFGELTFHPEGGFGPIYPDKYDFILGDSLRLP